MNVNIGWIMEESYRFDAEQVHQFLTLCVCSLSSGKFLSTVRIAG